MFWLECQNDFGSPVSAKEGVDWFCTIRSGCADYSIDSAQGFPYN